jgi:hypothetical protein
MTPTARCFPAKRRAELKLGFRALPLIVAALLQAAVAQTIPQLNPFSADIQVTSGHGGATHDVNGKMYVDPGHMRMDLNAGPRGGMAIITNFATRTTDMLMPEQHMYMESNADQAMARHPGLAPNIKPFTDPSNPCANEAGTTCKNVGVEEVNGRSCDHWQMTDKNGKVTNTWIDRKLHFPIKSVSEDTTYQLTNIKEGDQPASLFEIPSGYQKMDLGQMMQGMRQQQ